MALGTTGLVVTAAVVAAATGAGTAWVVSGSSRPPSAPASPDEGHVAALEDRVAGQQTEITDLRARLEEALRSRPVPPMPPGGPRGPGPGGPGAPPTGPDGRPLEFAGPGPSPGAPDAGMPPAALSPEERARFEVFYREMRQKEQEDQRKARLAAAEAQLRGRLDRLPDALGLTPDLKDAIAKNLLDRAERTREAFEEARASGAPDAFKTGQEKVTAIRQESRQALQAMLTAEQLRAVEALDRGGGDAMRNPGRLGGRVGGQRGEQPAGGRPVAPPPSGGDPPR